MKTEISSKKATSATLLALIVSGSAFAQTQNSITANDDSSNNLTFALCILLFIVGFAVLIVLKMRDDKKHPKQNGQHQQPHSLHRNHYGHKHQYHH
ncbi:MAG: hypothetical protein ABI388_00650 [Bacteroidia bacterium]